MSGEDQILMQRIASAIFYPRQDMPYGPEATGAFDDLFEAAPGVRLRSRYFLCSNRSSPNILFFHGNGETARDYDYFAEEYRALPASLIVAEYRGYGPSIGEPSFDSFLSDAHRSLDRARELLEEREHDGPLVVMGRSLGSAPAIELACSRADVLSALIVESGFADILPLLELFGLPAYELEITEEHGPQNRSKMRQVSLPTLIMHAELDQIIPINEGESLFEACRDPQKGFLRVPDAGHNNIHAAAGAAYFTSIERLLARVG
ncbi:MAG: alpha/beta hydrolase [Deltaproteobacteria bacterium]|nr:alpha/beta hydrolase [Deltaproteobacteria bacterium]